jgi:hypothetical protein
METEQRNLDMKFKEAKSIGDLELHCKVTEYCRTGRRTGPCKVECGFRGQGSHPHLRPCILEDGQPWHCILAHLPITSKVGYQGVCVLTRSACSSACFSSIVSEIGILNACSFKVRMCPATAKLCLRKGGRFWLDT